jgi:hypothetical protein
MTRNTRLAETIAATLLALALGGASQPALAQTSAPDAGSMVEVQGGGFIFNYRIGEAFYGIVLKPKRALPTGTVIEVAFENPAGGEPFLARETFAGSPKAISMRTPPVQGVRAGRDYVVEIRLRDPGSDAVIAETSTRFRSNVDQDILPDKPVTIGPGYHRNPAAGPDSFAK